MPPAFFPSRPPAACKPSDILSRALGEAPRQVYESAEDLMDVFDSETTVADMQPDVALLSPKLDICPIVGQSLKQFWYIGTEDHGLGGRRYDGKGRAENPWRDVYTSIF